MRGSSKLFILCLLFLAIFLAGHEAASLSRPADDVIARDVIAVMHIPDKEELQRRINQYGYGITVDGLIEDKTLYAWSAALIDQANRAGEAHADIITFHFVMPGPDPSEDP
jgi:hypothetical protein